MNPRKFYAPNSRDALRKVRETLGPNAVVLSNRPVSHGVEVVAVLESDLAQMNDDEQRSPFMAAQSPSDDTVTVARQSDLNRTHSSSTPPTKNPVHLEESLPVHSSAIPPSEKSRPTRLSVSEQVLEQISDMKHILETQLSMVAWGDLQRRDPERVKLTKHLLNCGFSPVLVRTLMESLPPKNNFETGLQWIRSVLNRNLNAIESGTDFVDKGGIYAILGSTGSGKTTTTAKLAARYVLRHGTSKLALLTMDSYRMGGGEQLRMYAKILGVPVYSVRDGDDLEIKLQELSTKHMILIDTVGISQRDQYIQDHLRVLQRSKFPIQSLLILNATSAPSVLDDVVTTYQSGVTLQGSILTKTDESASLGPVLDILIRRQLSLLFLTNGQRVPEDLYQPNRQYLLHKSLKYDVEQSPHSFDDDEVPLIMTGVEASPEEERRILGID